MNEPTEGFADLVPGICRIAEKTALVLLVIALFVALAMQGWWWAAGGVLGISLVVGCIKIGGWFMHHWGAP